MVVNQMMLFVYYDMQNLAVASGPKYDTSDFAVVRDMIRLSGVDILGRQQVFACHGIQMTGLQHREHHLNHPSDNGLVNQGQTAAEATD